VGLLKTPTTHALSYDLNLRPLTCCRTSFVLKQRLSWEPLRCVQLESMFD
jgi:hypothetical protein